LVGTPWAPAFALLPRRNRQSIDAMASEPHPMTAGLAPATVAASGAGGQLVIDSPRVIDSDTLLAGASQLAILHNQTIYFLRQTRFGKLILTK
jgi:hemin uptake protein HemP